MTESSSVDPTAAPTRRERYVYITLTVGFAVIFVMMLAAVVSSALFEHRCAAYGQCG